GHHHSHPQRRGRRRLGRLVEAAHLRHRRRRRLQRRHAHLRRPRLRRRGGRGAGRRGHDGHARAGQHPLPPVERAHEQGAARRGGLARPLQLLALRVHADHAARRRSGAELRPRRAERAAALRRHHRRRPVHGAPGLAGPAGRERAARLRRAHVPLRPLVHQERPHGGVRVERERRREGDGRGAAPRRARRAARVRPPLRHGGAGPNRHRGTRPAEGVRAGGQGPAPVLADPRRAVRGGVPRDHPPPRPYPHRLARQPGRAERPRHHRARHFPRRPPVDALAHRHRPEAPRRDRHHGRALPDRVRPARHHPEALRAVQALRRQHGPRHGHLPAQHARRDAAGRLPGPHPGDGPALPHHHGAVRGRHGRWRQGAGPRRHRPPRFRLPRGFCDGGRDPPDDAAGPRPDALPDLRRRRPRAQGGVRGRPASGARRRGADHGLPRRRRAPARGAEARGGPRAVAGLGPPPGGADQPADLQVVV
ncbi:MAG: Amidohydrolase, partial [uncultured Acetobacteraceae bacterium]